MPAKKPVSLQEGHQTKEEKQIRLDAEASLSPISDLPALSAKLKGHAVATEEWRYLMKLYSELNAEVVSSLDLRLLTDYCLLVEQIGELDEIRSDAIAAHRGLKKQHAALVKKKKLVEATALLVKIDGIIEAVVSIDARVGRARALLHQFAQSLYLTPRARAGYIPPKKSEPVPRDEMEKILDDATSEL